MLTPVGGPASRPPSLDDIGSLLEPPITFAHRGGSAHGDPNSIDTFGRALAMGARGLETDAWVTADGQVALSHDPRVRVGRMRWRPLATLSSSEIPSEVATLAGLYAAHGTDYELSVDVRSPGVAPAVIATATAAGACHRLWICLEDMASLGVWVEDLGSAAAVHTTRLRQMPDGPERHADRLATAGFRAVNMRIGDWSGGLCALFHRFGILAFGWGIEHDRQVQEAARMGLDGVYSDHVDRLVAVFG